ncbi:Phosphoserine phosphatase 1 [subsurface metagenome]
MDFALSKKGLKQAKELIRELNKYKFDVFIVSPLKRTIQTIQPYLNILSNPEVVVNGLTLEREGGEFTGGPQDGIRKYCEKNNLNKVSFRPKKGESILDVYKRAKKFIKFLKDNFNDESILICGHKNFLICLEVALENKSIKDYYSFKPLENKEIRQFSL